MNRRTFKTVALAALFLGHGVVTVLAMMEVGYLGIFEDGFATWGARQVFSDLVVSLLLITSWMLRDARKHGVNAWPFVIAALPLGSFAPLAYLLWRSAKGSEPVSAASPRLA